MIGNNKRPQVGGEYVYGLFCAALYSCWAANDFANLFAMRSAKNFRHSSSSAKATAAADDVSISISVINQLDAQNFFLFHNEFISCVCIFRAPCAHHQEVKSTLHSLWYHHTYRWPSRAQSQTDATPNFTFSLLQMCSNKLPLATSTPSKQNTPLYTAMNLLSEIQI